MTPAATIPSEIGLRDTLRRLQSEAESQGATDLVHGFAALDERLRSRRLLVAVVGEHNRGKSTLINSLIGEAWLPVGQGAPTLPPVYLHAGAQDRVEFVYGDGSTAESTREELLDLGPEDAAAISYARVALANPDLQGLVLVDTPGLNDPESGRLAETVRAVLGQCDVVLLVLDSAQALGTSEREFVEQQLLGAGYHRLVVVLNRDDALEGERQREAVRERVTRLLAPVLASSAPELLPYAARTALRAREQGDTRLLARSGYPELRALLADCAAERGKILQESVAVRARSLGGLLRTRMEAIPDPVGEAALVDTTAIESEKVVQARRALTRVGEQYSLELSAFAIDLRDRLAEEAAEAEPEDLRRYLPFYIQEQFATFLREREPEVLAHAQEAVREAGLENLPALALTVRPPAPGLHPFVAPDFLEDSLLLTTFLTVIGLTLRPIMSTMMMTLGPMLRMLTRQMREQDERGALVRAAQASVMQAAAILERQIAPAFTTATEALTLAGPPAPPRLVETVDDSAGRARVEALLQSLDARTDSSMRQ
ncbi:MAG TPA: dynamin family protein [Chloroflexota bacterium]|jgi:hypothetical protein